MILMILFLGCFLFNYGFSTSFAAKIDLYNVIGETQQTYDENGRHIFVWWMADPYWKALVSRSNLKPGDAELVLASLKPYIMIAVSNFNARAPKNPKFLFRLKIFGKLSKWKLMELHIRRSAEKNSIPLL